MSIVSNYGDSCLEQHNSPDKMLLHITKFKFKGFQMYKTSSFSRIALMLSLLTSGAASAAAATESAPLMDRNKFSIGFGVSSNSVSGPADDETGYQFFAGYELDMINIMEGVDTSVEFGYMDYGYDGRDTDGLWATGVVDGYITDQFRWVGRLGFDFGDDSGLMLGVGAGLALSQELELRAEYVIRDEIDSIQINVLFHL